MFNERVIIDFLKLFRGLRLPVVMTGRRFFCFRRVVFLAGVV